MQRTLVTGLAAVAVAAMLTACGLTFEFVPIEPDGSVSSGTDPTNPRGTVTLAAGQTKWIEVLIPSGQRSTARRLVIEADDDDGASALTIVLYDGAGITPLASTSGNAFFRPGLAGVGTGFVGTASVERADRASREPLAERAISLAVECVGPCLARTANVASVLVRITNDGPSGDVVPFYAYTEPWNDPGETQNASPAGAVAVTPASPYRGAIERLGDEDYVRFNQNGMITFLQRPGYNLNLQLDVFTPGGAFVATYTPGAAPFPVFANEVARIRSNPSAPRASVYGFYDVFY